MPPKKPQRPRSEWVERGPQQGHPITLRLGVRGIAMSADAFFGLKSPHPKHFFKQGQTHEPILSDELAFKERRREESEEHARKKPAPTTGPPERAQAPDDLIEGLKARGWDDKRIRQHVRKLGFEYSPDLVHALHKPNRVRQQMKRMLKRAPRGFTQK
jgi:hypothetical protein